MASLCVDFGRVAGAGAAADGVGCGGVVRAAAAADGGRCADRCAVASPLSATMRRPRCQPDLVAPTIDAAAPGDGIGR